MYRCGDYKWQTKNVLIEWKKPLEKDIDIFANSSLSLYVSIFRMELRWYCQLKTKTFFLSFEKYVKSDRSKILQTNKKIPSNTDEMNIPIHLNFPDGFPKKPTTAMCKTDNNNM